VADAEDQGGNGKLFTVGIGASAGGIEALEKLLGHVKLDSMAFVVVQHLSPDRTSSLPELLQRASGLPAVTATQGVKIEANHIYVIPPNADLAILGGALQVMPVAEGSVRLPVDYFFRSLAHDQGASSVGIILSGTGSDGTLGLKTIKEAGGITFAQEPESAKFDGMPRSAIDSGWVDFSLTPQAMAEALIDVHRHFYISGAAPDGAPRRDSTDRLLVLIRGAHGTDLTYYKEGMVERRIERRMALHRLTRLEDYVKLAQSNGKELELLYKDMLIGVTSFFRDHAPFEALKTTVFPRILDDKEPGSQVRIWVPACSTGEEAYSIAICLLEYLEEKSLDLRVQIFGTDIDASAIQQARRGAYPLNIALDVTSARLHRFFVKHDSEYQVSRSVRDLVVFSVQNITRDAPFSRLDLVSCRNLLIYLSPPAQKRVMRVFHYALSPGAMLMLGTSETVGESVELFSLVDRGTKLYVKKQVPAMMPVDLTPGLPPRSTMPPPGVARRPSFDIPAMADRRVLEQYGPPGVVIGEDMEIIYIRGRVSPYLEPMPGAPSFNILRLAPPELHVDLRRAVHEAQITNAKVTVPSQLREPGGLRKFDLEVQPLNDPDVKAPLLLVLFVEPKTEMAKVLPMRALESRPEEMQALERELEVTKDFLQTTIEELESANEELKSSNEEMQSSNEELQSTNEELESSKEELQSSNEELTTANDELQQRMSDLQQSNDDLHNVMLGIGNAVVIVGMDLRIRRYTHAAGKLLNLIDGDIGRSVGQLNAFLGGERVEKLASEVISTLTPIEREMVGSDKRWYDLSIAPYKTLDHTIKGAVITLSDIQTRKTAPNLARDVAEYASGFLGFVEHPLLIADSRLRLVWANEACYELFASDAERAVGLPLAELIGAPAELAGLIQEAIATGTPLRQRGVELSPPKQGKLRAVLTATRIPPLGSGATLILLSFELMKKEETEA
jgi:two-component system CheB/CheR fusion protein